MELPRRNIAESSGCWNFYNVSDEMVKSRDGTVMVYLVSVGVLYVGQFVRTESMVSGNTKLD